MIRQLTNEDFQAVETYLEKDHINNVYIIHALHMYGLENKHAVFWGAYDKNHLSGVLYFEYVENLRQGSLCGDRNSILIQLGKNALNNGIDILVGKKEYFLPIIDKYLRRFEVEGRYDFKQETDDQSVTSYDYPVKFATIDDVPLLVELYKKSDLGETWNKTERDIEIEILRSMRYESGYFFVEQNDRAVCAAKIVAETNKYGMIDGATTLHEFRRRGIYRSVRTACEEYLLEKNKIGLSIIAENDPVIQNFSNKLRNEFIGKWLILKTRKKPGIKVSVKRKLRPLKNLIISLFRGHKNEFK